jgi:hypothetical protein
MKRPNWWRQFRDDGTIDRIPYLLIGLILCLIKFRIDTAVAYIGYGRDWTPWDYLISGSTLTTLLRVPEDRSFFLMLFALSLPFVVIGIGLTYARLQSVGLHPLLVLLFFLPVLNLILIFMLVILKPRPVVPAPVPSVDVPFAVPASNSEQPVLAYGTDRPAESAFRELFPKSKTSSLAMASTLSAGSALVMTWLGVDVFQNYGWGIFVALPFLCGLIAAVLHGVGQPRSLKQCLGAAALAPTILGAGVFIVGVDGAGCVIMALPIIIPMSLLGGVIGYHLQRGPLRGGGTQPLVLLLIAFMPIFLGAEHIANPPAPVFKVVTSVDIDTPPDRVWRHVVAFSRIDPPTEWVFRLGVAYPIEARIEGEGVGATRHCIFSTGEFTEPITAWNANQLLKFDVSSNPPAMREVSLWDIHPPHVRDFLISHGGQFRLIPLAGNRTQLEGTTWYEHNLWPAGYWRLWSDYLIHKIHSRVLEHVKEVTEADSSG